MLGGERGENTKQGRRQHVCVCGGGGHQLLCFPGLFAISLTTLLLSKHGPMSQPNPSPKPGCPYPPCTHMPTDTQAHTHRHGCTYRCQFGLHGPHLLHARHAHQGTERLLA